MYAAHNSLIARAGDPPPCHNASVMRAHPLRRPLSGNLARPNPANIQRHPAWRRRRMPMKNTTSKARVLHSRRVSVTERTCLSRFGRRLLAEALEGCLSLAGQKGVGVALGEIGQNLLGG